MIITLTRVESSDQGTFGRLLDWYTLELPWRENRIGLSCLPEGQYGAFWAFSPSFRKKTYRLTKTSPRGGILIHSANLAGDKSKGYRAQLQGCIALGERLGWLDGQKAVLVSRPAVAAFEKLMGLEPFILDIKNA